MTLEPPHRALEHSSRPTLGLEFRSARERLRRPGGAAAVRRGASYPGQGLTQCCPAPAKQPERDRGQQCGAENDRQRQAEPARVRITETRAEHVSDRGAAILRALCGTRASAGSLRSERAESERSEPDPADCSGAVASAKSAAGCSSLAGGLRRGLVRGRRRYARCLAGAGAFTPASVTAAAAAAAAGATRRYCRYRRAHPATAGYRRYPRRRPRRLRWGSSPPAPGTFSMYCPIAESSWAGALAGIANKTAARVSARGIRRIRQFTFLTAPSCTPRRGDLAQGGTVPERAAAGYASLAQPPAAAPFAGRRGACRGSQSPSRATSASDSVDVFLTL